MIEIRYKEGGDWQEVTRQQAMDYACDFIYGHKEVCEFFDLAYFNKKLIRGTKFTAAELRRHLYRKFRR